MSTPELACQWVLDEIDGAWLTECRQAFVLNDGAPSENDMRFCCYCGKALCEVENTRAEWEK